MLEHIASVVCMKITRFHQEIGISDHFWPAANSLNLSLLPSLGLTPAKVGTAGVPEPGLMGRRHSDACPWLRTLWRRPSWVRIPPPAPLKIAPLSLDVYTENYELRWGDDLSRQTGVNANSSLQPNRSSFQFDW